MVRNHHLAKSISDAGSRAVHNDPDLQSGRSWENGDQSESGVYVTGLLAMRPSKQYQAGDANLSLLEMRAGDPSR
jgi:hypothetical protein